MFLKPTAKPTPRRTPSPRVVFPAPPGSRIASRGSSSGSGSGSAAARRITSRVGQRARDHLAGGEHAARLERVQEPQLDRVDVERRGELVHLRLGREARLHGAEAAHRAARRVVRVDGEPVDRATLSTAYGPTANEQAFEMTAVELDAYAPPSMRIRMRTATSSPVARRPVLGPDPRRVAVDVPDERLLAVVDHLHGPARAQREHRGVDLHREVLAAAERAADAREVDPHLLRRRGRGTARPGRGRRAATASRRGCRRRPRRPGSRCPTRARGTPDPAARPRRRPRR